MQLNLTDLWSFLEKAGPAALGVAGFAAIVDNMRKGSLERKKLTLEIDALSKNKEVLSSSIGDQVQIDSGRRPYAADQPSPTSSYRNSVARNPTLPLAAFAMLVATLWATIGGIHDTRQLNETRAKLSASENQLTALRQEVQRLHMDSAPTGRAPERPPGPIGMRLLTVPPDAPLSNCEAAEAKGFAFEVRVRNVKASDTAQLHVTSGYPQGVWTVPIGQLTELSGKQDVALLDNSELRLEIGEASLVLARNGPAIAKCGGKEYHFPGATIRILREH